MDRHLGEYESLDSEREHVIAYWAHVVVAAIQASETLATAISAQHRRYVLDRAIWAVTEIHPGIATKYQRQRFWSHGALELAAASLPERKPRPNDFRHEHVLTRRELIPVLAAATGLEGVTAVLCTATACVVTKREADLLNAEWDGGWERYRRAEILVYDRQERATLSTGDVETSSAPALRPASERGPGGARESRRLVAVADGRDVRAPAARPGSIGARSVAALDRLEAAGGLRYFPDLHHFIKAGRRAGFRGHRNYCGAHEIAEGSSNAVTMARIECASELRAAGHAWPEAVAEAWRRHPHRG